MKKIETLLKKHKVKENIIKIAVPAMEEYMGSII